MNQIYEFFQTLTIEQKRYAIAIVIIINHICGILIGYALNSESKTKDSKILDDNIDYKRGDFYMLYRHCVATIAEGYQSRDKDGSFGLFLARHAEHLSRHHNFPKLSQKELIRNPILYSIKIFDDPTEFLDTLIILYERSITNDPEIKAYARRKL